LPGIDLSKRVLIALSSHGFGHLGQTAPAIQALKSRKPEVEIIVRGRLPAFKLREKLGDDIRIQSADLDIGFVQKDALTIDFDKTIHEYERFHRQWDALLRREKQDLLKTSPDLIIANIPYLTLAAAHQLGIPCIAFSSLNWAEIYQYCFGHRPESRAILKQMLNAYNQASCFLRPTPPMKMPGIENPITIGPLAQIGQDVSLELKSKLGLDASEMLVLVSLGGMEVKTACEDWPRFSGIHFLVPESWDSRHPDTSVLETLGYSFVDLLRSSDVLIAKPGYGSFVEAACTGTPVLYLPRQNWPEAPVLIDWLKRQGRCKEVSYEEFQAGDLQRHIENVSLESRHRAIAPTGIQQAVNKFCEYL
jgi:uncharacterized protein (TIGR00661 family)